MIRYQCKNDAGGYGGSSYAPYSQPSGVGTYRSNTYASGAQLMNQSAGWNNLAMLAQARQQEREHFKQCMEANGYTAYRD